MSQAILPEDLEEPTLDSANLTPIWKVEPRAGA
jgi:hypothetical protein